MVVKRLCTVHKDNFCQQQHASQQTRDIDKKNGDVVEMIHAHLLEDVTHQERILLP